MSDSAISNAAGWMESIREMVAKLDAANDDGGNEEQEAAAQAIHESPLSVQVRGGWYSPGEDRSELAPEEYEVLLSTGGPALRIIGDLGSYGSPDSATLQWQDWGTPWTDYFADDAETNDANDAALTAFVGQFYFGEG